MSDIRSEEMVNDPLEGISSTIYIQQSSSTAVYFFSIVALIYKIVVEK